MLGEQRLGTLPHAAGNDVVDATFSKPGRKQTGLVRRSVNILADHDGFPLGIGVDQSKAGAVTEMHGQFSVG
jgi:hypothetical protein